MNELTFNTLYLSNGNAEKDAVCLGSFRRHHPDASILVREFKKENFLNEIQEAAITLDDDLTPRFTNLVILDDTTFITRKIRIQPRPQVAGALRFPDNKEIFMFDKFDYWGQKVIATKSGLFISAVIFSDLLSTWALSLNNNIKELYDRLIIEYPDVGFDCIFSLVIQDFGYSVGEWCENSRFEVNLGRDLLNRYIPTIFDANRTILSNHFII